MQCQASLLHLGSCSGSQQLVHLVAQPLVQGPDPLQVSPDLHQPCDDGVICHGPPFCLDTMELHLLKPLGLLLLSL